MTTANTSRAGSVWAALVVNTFRILWLASLVSNIGDWMQTVGAQWLLVHQPQASILVPLVQTANMLPGVLLAYVGGILADIFNRRIFMLVVQGGQVLLGILLALLTFYNLMSPALLLTLTFLLGAGSVLILPAYQAIIPDLVPRQNLASASALGSINVNIARAIGPAIAGLLIAQIGVAAVFGLNTLTFLFFALVILFWHPSTEATTQQSERFFSALGAGERYVRNAPVVLHVLIRLALFLIPASALWSLLPLIASQRLRLGANGYGFQLAALGVGAIIGVFLLPPLRARFKDNTVLLISSVVYAIALIAVALLSHAVALLLVFIPTGIVWILVLSSLNTTMQLFLPSWVRARGLSIYQMVLFGTQAAGAVLWGLVAGPAGLQITFLIAAALMLLGLATFPLWPLLDIQHTDRTLTTYGPMPHLLHRAGTTGGPNSGYDDLHNCV